MAVLLFVKPPAPAGLPVASTASIIVSGLPAEYGLNGTYSKSAWTGYGGGVIYDASNVYYNPNYTGGDKDGAAIGWSNNESRWKFTYYNDNAQILTSTILGLSASHLPSTSTDWLAGTNENYYAGLTTFWTGSINITEAPAGIPVSSASVVLNLTRPGYGYPPTTTLVKKSTIGEYLGNVTGDVLYLTSGFVYKSVNIISGTDYGSTYLVPPSAGVGDAPTPNNYNWAQPSSFWRILDFYSDDGTRYTDFGHNSSTSTTTIPSTGWIPDPNYPAISDNPNGVTAVSITAS
jgi:hypothetical protein